MKLIVLQYLIIFLNDLEFFAYSLDMNDLPSVILKPPLFNLSLRTLPESVSSLANKLTNRLPVSIRKQANDLYLTIPKTILDDAILMVPEIIEKYGYSCETHKVITPDGYILTMHRIPKGKSGSINSGRIVYLQHGLFSSSADWILTGPDRSLAYILADNGYDVWIANCRGNRYSRNHVSLNPDNSEFWDFSWHEIAILDVTTMIDYVLNNTKQEQLFYVGHSQGTTAFYVMGSERPEYNKKIKAQFSLAPIGYMNHMTSPVLQAIVINYRGFGLWVDSFGIDEFLPDTGTMGRLGRIFCSDTSATQILCANFYFLFSGFNPKEMNTTLLPLMMAHTPAGASTKQVLHYVQEVKSGKFCYYDHGALVNEMKYGQKDPPRYLLHKVTAPVYLFYSNNDLLSNEIDVMKLYTELGNVKEKYLIADRQFNHIDYLYAIHAPELVYKNLLNVMDGIS